MPKWRYSRTETFEIDAPAWIGTSEGDFLQWLANAQAPGAPALGAFVGTFLHDAHPADALLPALLPEPDYDECAP